MPARNIGCQTDLALRKMITKNGKKSRKIQKNRENKKSAKKQKNREKSKKNREKMKKNPKKIAKKHRKKSKRNREKIEKKSKKHKKNPTIQLHRLLHHPILLGTDHCILLWAVLNHLARVEISPHVVWLFVSRARKFLS